MSDQTAVGHWIGVRAVVLGVVLIACAFTGLAAGWILGFATSELPAYPLPGAVTFVALAVAAIRYSKSNRALLVLLTSASLACACAWALLLIGGAVLNDF